jgi:hypothetical protein
VKERPILFSGSMIRAILDGRKTQIRRVVAPQQPKVSMCDPYYLELTERDGSVTCYTTTQFTKRCPHGHPGDRLWVKETIRRVAPDGLGCARFAADDEPTAIDTWPWKRDVLTAIHTPRGASRITLELTEVRVQRLQEISEDDARAEGVEPYTPPHGHISPEQRVPGPGFDRVRLGDQPHRLPFADLWDTINGKRAPWESNPWVWALTFRRLP